MDNEVIFCLHNKLLLLHRNPFTCKAAHDTIIFLGTIIIKSLVALTKVLLRTRTLVQLVYNHFVAIIILMRKSNRHYRINASFIGVFFARTSNSLVLSHTHNELSLTLPPKVIPLNPLIKLRTGRTIDRQG